MKPIVIIMCGPPGSGKSTWIKNKIPDSFISVSRDEIREFMFGKKYTQNESDEKKVTKCFDHLLEDAALAYKNIVIDKTNVDTKYLDEYIKDFKGTGYIFHIKFFNTPLWLCRIRNIKRWVKTGRLVPYKVIKNMKDRFDKINQDNYKEYAL
jgi:predicted kinase